MHTFRKKYMAGSDFAFCYLLCNTIKIVTNFFNMYNTHTAKCKRSISQTYYSKFEFGVKTQTLASSHKSIFCSVAVKAVSIALHLERKHLRHFLNICVTNI